MFTTSDILNPAVLAITHEGDDVCLRLPPHMDETVEFPNLRLRLSQRIIFECGDVIYVNSFAMQKWIQWMRSQPPERQYVFRACHGKVIEMMNAVAGFRPHDTVVESFYMPYTCLTCGGEDELLLKRGKDYIEAFAHQKPRLLYPNQINCPHCRQIMEVGVLEHVYLRFLERRCE